MKKYVLILSIVIQFLLHTPLYCLPDNALLFIDTQGYTHYHFDTLFTLLKAAGFCPIFEQLHNLDVHVIQHFKTIVVTISPELCNAYYADQYDSKNGENPLIKLGINLLSNLKEQKDKVIVLLFPPAHTNNTYQACLFLLNDLVGNQDASFSSFFSWLLASDAQKIHYHTSLLTLNQITQKSPPLFKNNDAKFTPLPRKSDAQSTIGFYYTNDINQYFISKTSLFTFAEINENFLYNPIDPEIRKKKLLDLYHLIQEFKSAISNGFFNEINLKNKLPLKLNHTHSISKYNHIACDRMNNTTPQFDTFNSEKIWVGWTELRTYKNQEKEAAENILKSGINLLWFQLTPERYLSKNAIEAAQKQQFLKNFTAFTKALKEKSRELSLNPPALFVGTNITSNFYQKNLPEKQQAIDVYGTIYPKTPSPLDKSFWKEEVIKPIFRMIKQWRTIGSGLPLGGIFFDFEMYFSQLGEYNNYFDFSDISWNLYTEHNNHPELKALKTTQERVHYLIAHKKFNEYLAVLQLCAYQLGRWIKNTIQKRAPNCMFGAYCINLPHTWFYLGILAGLSTIKQPIILATFNNEFARHYKWLKNHQIYAYHLPVLLLSKLENSKDFELIPLLSADHDGLWFNRISHWEESRDKQDWPWNFGAEVTPLETDIVIKNLNQYIQKALLNTD